jgi:hypothetical protein
MVLVAEHLKQGGPINLSSAEGLMTDSIMVVGRSVGRRDISGQEPECWVKPGFFVFVVLGFKFRASYLLGRHSTN